MGQGAPPPPGQRPQPLRSQPSSGPAEAENLRPNLLAHRYNCYDAGLKVKEALACPGHPAMHGGLSINPLKFLGAPPPEAFLALRLKPHPEEVAPKP